MNTGEGWVWKKKNIVITGASGNVGKYFADYLKNNIDFNKYAITAVGTRETDFFEKNKIEYVRADISKPEDLDKLPGEVYAVVHMAAVMPAGMHGFFPQRYIDVNVTGTLNVLEYCRRAHADRIVFTQSFGDIKDNAKKDILLKADSPRNFSFNSDHTIYVISKNAAVDMIKSYYEMFQIKYFVLRLPNIYLYSPVDAFCIDGIERKLRSLYDRPRDKRRGYRGLGGRLTR